MNDRPRIPGRRLLHSPGPTPIPDEVLHALTRQPMDMGDPRVDEDIARVSAGLQRLLRTTAEVFMFIGNGHGAWEAAVENFIPPEGVALVAGTGHFSEGWAVQSEALGRRVVRTPWREGFPIDADAVAGALRDDRERRIAAVFMVHTDTSSGVTSDVAALRRAMDDSGHPALLVVDVVASLCAEPFDMDALGVDAALGASQKGLMCPPGVSFIAANARAVEVALRNPARRHYWDIVARREPMSYRRFCGTPPQNLLAAMVAAIGLLEHEGLDRVLARHQRHRGLVHAAVEGWKSAGAVDFFARDPPSRSAAVTTVLTPPGTPIDRLREIAREDFQCAFAGALGPLHGKGFRIGHLGDQNPAQMLGALGAMEAALRAVGVPVGDGVGAAVKALAAPYMPA
jgi:alanine-glyoxylate transaminase/serine-glyoxylate transaminase/serine-pyruvate transaminase